MEWKGLSHFKLTMYFTAFLFRSDNEIGITACAVSPQNLIAFASYGKLRHGGATGQQVNKNLNVIYVCDANTPWDTHM